MDLYHGSNLEVREPKLFFNVRALDFGSGFYLTSSLEQASKWANLTVRRRKNGVPVVTVFEFNMEDLQKLSVLKFKEANAEWLKFVSANRTCQATNRIWDVVIGPVANDNTMTVLNLYMKGDYDENEALKRLLPQKLKDQYVFRTSKAISYLRLKEVIKL